MGMKTAEEWVEAHLWKNDPALVKLVRAIQADALEAAAERLREEARLLLVQGGPTQSAMVTSMSMKHAAEVVCRIKPQ